VFQLLVREYMAATVSGLSLRAENGQSSGRPGRKLAICLSIFLLAFSVRLLHWQNNRPNFGSVFSVMVALHEANAALLLRGNFRTFLTGPAPPDDANILTYPPGYPIFEAATFELISKSDAAVRLVQVGFDSGSAVLLFLLAANLFRNSVAIIAGILAALSPQLSYYSTLLLPDSPVTFPLILALYLLTRAMKAPRLVHFILIGFCIGTSCWLRSNALLLALFFAGAILIMFRSRRGWWYSSAVVLTTITVIAPITIRNYVVFHHFIPVSLGAGHMLTLGISDYDKARRFGLPDTDTETMRMEVGQYERPDYANSLYGGGGIEREQLRTAKALAVIRSHPFWFTGVIVRRAFSMMRLERVPILSAMAQPSRALEVGDAKPVWIYPDAMVSQATNARPDNRTMMRVNQPFASPPIAMQTDSEYVLQLPVTIETGAVVIRIEDRQSPNQLAASEILQPLEPSLDGTRESQMVAVPFVNRNASEVVIIVEDASNHSATMVADVGALKIYKLGPARFQWLRFPRLALHLMQKLFVTAWIIPPALLGLAFLVRLRLRRELLILLILPIYYMSVQSLIHTEYRYVMALQLPEFVMTAVGLCGIFVWLRQFAAKRTVIRASLCKLCILA